MRRNHQSLKEKRDEEVRNYQNHDERLSFQSFHHSNFGCVFVTLYLFWIQDSVAKNRFHCTTTDPSWGLYWCHPARDPSLCPCESEVWIVQTGISCGSHEGSHETPSMIMIYSYYIILHHDGIISYIYIYIYIYIYKWYHFLLESFHFGYAVDPSFLSHEIMISVIPRVRPGDPSPTCLRQSGRRRARLNLRISNQAVYRSVYRYLYEIYLIFIWDLYEIYEVMG